MAFKRSNLTLGDVWEYDYSILKNQDEKILRKEYSRLRDIAQKRLKRLSQSEWTWTQNYQRYKGGFAKLSELEGKDDLAHELADLGHFVYNKASSISGLEEIREKSVKSLEENGYSFINEENWKEWTDFMNDFNRMFYGRSPVPEELIPEEYRDIVKSDPDRVAREFKEFLKKMRK